MRTIVNHLRQSISVVRHRGRPSTFIGFTFCSSTELTAAGFVNDGVKSLTVHGQPAFIKTQSKTYLHFAEGYFTSDKRIHGHKYRKTNKAYDPLRLFFLLNLFKLLF